MRLTVAIFAILFTWATACRKEPTVTLLTFREISSPVAGDFSDIRMLDSLHGVAVGGKAWESGFILSSADGGQTWRTDTLLERKMEGIAFDRDGQSYVCGQDFVVYRPAGSSHWDAFRVNYLWNRACHFPDSRHGVVVTGGAFRLGNTLTFGPDASWRLDTVHETANVLADVQFSDSVTAHAVGLGWVLRSDDAGQSWQRLDATGDFFRSVCFPDPRTGYVCGSGGTLLKTVDGGTSWQEIRKGGSTGKRNQAFRSLCFVGADTGFVAGDDGLLWKTENGGKDWSQAEQVPDNVDFTGIFVQEGRGWAVAKGGRIFYFEY